MRGTRVLMRIQEKKERIFVEREMGRSDAINQVHQAFHFEKDAPSYL